MAGGAGLRSRYFVSNKSKLEHGIGRAASYFLTKVMIRGRLSLFRI